MNYRHAFHAGNHADVFKHLILSRIITLFSQKETPFTYIDTHSGIGVYDLQSQESNRTNEYLTGVELLLKQNNLPTLFNEYLHVIQHINTPSALRYYPGSPFIAQQLTRTQDQLIFNEKHPEDYQLLKQQFKQEKRASVHCTNGWLLPKALLPTKEKRAIILIDPPFEQPDELAACASALEQAIQRMKNCIVAIWYPIKDHRELNTFYRTISQSSAPSLLQTEFILHTADNKLKLNGSGMIIANPPWKLENELTTLLPYLVNIFAPTYGSFKIKWLINKK